MAMIRNRREDHHPGRYRQHVLHHVLWNSRCDQGAATSWVDLRKALLNSLSYSQEVNVRRRKRPVTEMNLNRQMRQSKRVGENLTVQDDQVVATLEARLQDI